MRSMLGMQKMPQNPRKDSEESPPSDNNNDNDKKQYLHYSHHRARAITCLAAYGVQRPQRWRRRRVFHCFLEMKLYVHADHLYMMTCT